jgi:hypothetical protein
MRISPVVQLMLKGAKFLTAAHEQWVVFVHSLFGGAKRVLMPRFPLVGCLVAHLLVDFLKFDEVKRLLPFHSEVRGQNTADVSGIFCGHSPYILRTVFRFIAPLNARRYQVSSENMVQKRHRLRLAHSHGDSATKGGSVWTAGDRDAAFAVNNASGVSKIHGRDSVECGDLRKVGLIASFFLAFQPCLVSFFAGRMLKGHQISLTDRWFGLRRCANTCSALFYCTPYLAQQGVLWTVG